MNNTECYNVFDINMLMEKDGEIVSSAEALRDVKPVEWDDDVLQGDRKVIVKKKNII